MLEGQLTQAKKKTYTFGRGVADSIKKLTCPSAREAADTRNKKITYIFDRGAADSSKELACPFVRRAADTSKKKNIPLVEGQPTQAKN